MYATQSWFPGGPVDGGTTLLVRGPSMTRKTALVLSLLADGDDRDTVTLFVTTDDTPQALWTEYREYAPDADPRRVGIVDATGSPSTSGPADPAADDGGFATDGAGHPRVATVGSPADLTGIGMKATELLDDIAGDTGATRVRLGLFTLNTMAMYGDGERLARFVHAIANRLDAVEGFGLFVTHTDALEDGLEDQLAAFVDGAVDVRQDDGGISVRARGRDARSDWAPVELADPAGETAGRNPDQTDPMTDVDVPASLHAAIDAVRADRPTLTLCNVEDAAPSAVEAVTDHFHQRDVAVRTATLDAEDPRAFALLHRGPELLASANLAVVADAVDVSDDESFSSPRRLNVLGAIGSDTHGAGGVDRAFLAEASRVVELRAARTGGGRIDAGFQSLSRLWNEPRTRRIYERLAAAGVDVHAYGVDDATWPDETAVTVHASADPEIRDSWFVVHDGDGDGGRMGALVAEERDPGVYDGYWTLAPDRVRGLSAYVRRTHGE